MNIECPFVVMVSVCCSNRDALHAEDTLRRKQLAKQVRCYLSERGLFGPPAICGVVNRQQTVSK